MNHFWDFWGLVSECECCWYPLPSRWTWKDSTSCQNTVTFFNQSTRIHLYSAKINKKISKAQLFKVFLLFSQQVDTVLSWHFHMWLLLYLSLYLTDVYFVCIEIKNIIWFLPLTSMWFAYGFFFAELGKVLSIQWLIHTSERVKTKLCFLYIFVNESALRWQKPINEANLYTVWWEYKLEMKQHPAYMSLNVSIYSLKWC